MQALMGMLAKVDLGVADSALEAQGEADMSCLPW